MVEAGEGLSPPKGWLMSNWVKMSTFEKEFQPEVSGHSKADLKLATTAKIIEKENGLSYLTVVLAKSDCMGQ